MVELGVLLYDILLGDVVVYGFLVLGVLTLTGKLGVLTAALGWVGWKERRVPPLLLSGAMLAALSWMWFGWRFVVPGADERMNLCKAALALGAVFVRWVMDHLP